MRPYNYSRLYGRMREKGFTQKTLAERCLISETTLNLGLNNRRNFRQDEMEQILSALDVPLSEIDAFFYAQ